MLNNNEEVNLHAIHVPLQMCNETTIVAAI